MPTPEQQARLRAALQGFSKEQLQALASSWSTYSDDDPRPRNPLENPERDVSVLAYPGALNESGRAIVLPGSVPGNQLVNVLEPRSGSLAWWLQTSDFGNRYQGPIGDSGNLINVASLELAPGPTRPIAVTLFRSARNEGTPGNSEVYAQITYGAGGTTNSFLCDWINGGSLCLPATNIRVEAVAYSPNGDSPYNQPTGEVILGAHFGLGSVTPARPATFTSQYEELAAAGSITRQLPSFARRVYAVGDFSTIALSGFLVRLNGVGINTLSCPLSAEILSQGLPIPGGSSEVTLINTSGSNVANAALMFELGL